MQHPGWTEDGVKETQRAGMVRPGPRSRRLAELGGGPLSCVFALAQLPLVRREHVLLK